MNKNSSCFVFFKLVSLHSVVEKDKRLSVIHSGGLLQLHVNKSREAGEGRGG